MNTIPAKQYDEAVELLKTFYSDLEPGFTGFRNAWSRIQSFSAEFYYSVSPGFEDVMAEMWETLVDLMDLLTELGELSEKMDRERWNHIPLAGPNPPSRAEKYQKSEEELSDDSD